MSFQRRIENFVCENCGYEVAGTGYTNHCPKCLWSKHVDIHPGDRSAACGGMMEPIRVEGASPEYAIVRNASSADMSAKMRRLLRTIPTLSLRLPKTPDGA